MKMESPLDVLSRAASIVQKEENPSIRTSDRSSSPVYTHVDDSSRKGSPTPPMSPRERRSPKRQHSVTERSMKKLKLEDREESYRTSPKPYHIHLTSSPITATTFTTYQTPITAPIERKSHSKSPKNGSPPPLISIRPTQKHRSALPDYESLFPRPSVISSSPPTSLYIDYCRKGSSCRDCINEKAIVRDSKCPQLFRKADISSVISRDFDLPTVEDHFRKSLGDRYNFSKRYSSFDERPSSVDDHFAKALGTKWYSLEYSRCASS